MRNHLNNLFVSCQLSVVSRRASKAEAGSAYRRVRANGVSVRESTTDPGQRTTDKHPKRRGAIFVTALGAVAVVSGMVLVFAQSMRTEALASKNRVSALQASYIEQGAEQWVTAQIEAATPGDAYSIAQIDCEQKQVGDGYFWILRPDPTTDKEWHFGITDECSKINLNTGASAQLQLLPGVTDEAGDSIVDWRDSDEKQGPNGAESSYYQGLTNGYTAKNSLFETVEELQLVKGCTPLMLYGYDLNRDGVLDDAERAVGGTATSFNSASSDSRGLFNYVTVYSAENNTDSAGKARINVNDPNSKDKLTKYLQKQLPKAQASAVIAKLSPRPAYANILDFFIQTAFPKDSYAKVIDGLTTTRRKKRAGLVNINTAPKQVLLALGGLQDADCDNLIAKRSSVDTTNIAWVLGVIAPTTARQVGGSITARSFQYSADIVAVSGDGRSFKRARIVIDATTLPSKIVYRKDVTNIGWPLDPVIRDQLRAGVPLAQNSGGMLNFGGR